MSGLLRSRLIEWLLRVRLIDGLILRLEMLLLGQLKLLVGGESRLLGECLRLVVRQMRLVGMWDLLGCLLHVVSEVLQGRLGLLGFHLLELEGLFALGAEVVQVLDDPLPHALLVEDVLAGQQHCFLHVVVADSAGQVVELIQLLPLYPLEEGHGLGELLDPGEGVKGLLDLGEVVDAADDEEDGFAELVADPQGDDELNGQAGDVDKQGGSGQQLVGAPDVVEGVFLVEVDCEVQEGLQQQH